MDTHSHSDKRGQINFYANQFRTHAFSFIICKDTARLIYLDRSGAVVTKSFSYVPVKERWLEIFFWRYAHSSPAVHGVDESVTVPTDADAAYVQKARVALELDDKPVFKFSIYCTNSVNSAVTCNGTIEIAEM